MADQTLNRDVTEDRLPWGETASDATGLAYDMITLAELQGKLLYADVKEAGRTSMRSLIAVLIMMTVAISSIPVILVGLGRILADAAGWWPSLSIFLVVGMMAVATGLIGWWCYRRLTAVAGMFDSSRDELRHNYDFVKSIFSSPTDDDDAGSFGRFGEKGRFS